MVRKIEDLTTNKEENNIEYEGKRLKAPEFIAKTESQVRKILNSFSGQYEQWAMDLDKIEGQYYGRPPISSEVLKRKKLDYLVNINNGHSTKIIERYLSSEYNLVFGGRYKVQFHFNKFDDEDINYQVSKSLSKRWDEVYCSWEYFATNLLTMLKDRAMFGIGAVLREEDSWKFKAIEPKELRLPMGVSLINDSLDRFAVHYKKSISELFEKYENPGTYWNKEKLASLIYESAKKAGGNYNNIDDTILDISRRKRNFEDCSWGMYTTEVPLISVFIKEYNGKWTQCVIPKFELSNAMQSNLDEKKKEACLFFYGAKFEKLNDFFQIFPFSIGERFLKSSKGLGEKIFYPVAVQNLLDNNIINQAQMAGTTFFRERGGRGKDNRQNAINLGTFNFTDSEFITSIPQVNLQSTLAVNNYQRQTLEDNIQQQGLGNVDDPNNKYRTLGEVGLLAAQDSVIQKPQAHFLYTLLDKFYKDTIRIIFKGTKDDYFKEWKDRVLSDFKKAEPKIIEELNSFFNKEGGSFNSVTRLSKDFDVSVVKSTASGSQVNDIMASQKLVPFMSSMGTKARARFLKWYAEVNVSNYELADIFFEDYGIETVTSSMQKATAENNDLLSMISIPQILIEPQLRAMFSPDDNHVEETPIHFEAMEALLAAWQNSQMDVIETRNRGTPLFTHLNQHYLALQNIEAAKGLLDQLGPRYGNIYNMLKKVTFDANSKEQGEAIRRQKEEQQKLEQLARVEETSPEMLKVQMDAMIENRRLDEELARQRRAEDLQSIVLNNKIQQDNTIFLNEELRKDFKTKSEISKKTLPKNRDF